MTVSDVGREGVRLVAQLAGVAMSVPVVAGFVLLGGCRARRWVAPRRRAQAARNEVESTRAAQSCIGEAAVPAVPPPATTVTTKGDDAVIYYARTKTVTVPSLRIPSSRSRWRCSCRNAGRSWSNA